MIDNYCPYFYFIGKSWYNEYKRLKEEIPIIEYDCLDEHNNEVLHVSFSHNGKYFATSSKDGFIVVSINT